MELLIITIVGIGVVILFFFVLVKLRSMDEKNKEISDLRMKLDTTNREVNESLDRVTQRITERLDKVTDQVGVRLTENVRAINESKSFITQRVENTERTVREVTNRLTSLQEVSEKMMATNQEILTFQQMLKVPKVRGGFGEILLESLLRDSLPSDRYAMQYKFLSSGEIADAVIKLMDDNIVVIDSKFPLSNFEKIIVLEGEEKKSHFRLFINDIKKHVNDISSKYITPREHTLDYAFMYIPMEGIYYEVVVRRAEVSLEIWEYCMKHHVIPVSPNSFISYLHTLLMGFRGMKIEKQAKEIISYIGQLRKDFSKFEEEFLTVGTHLTHAKNKFEDSNRRLERFNSRLERIDVHEEVVELESGEKEKDSELTHVETS